MDESSFLSNSSKYKKRKPIFPKNEHSPVAKLNEHLYKSSSQIQIANRSSSQSSSNINSKAPNRPFESRVQVMRVDAPMNSSVRISYSQPKIVNPPSQHVIYGTRPGTPIVIHNVAQQRVIYQQPIQTTHSPPQNNFYQTMQPSTLRRSSHHLYQTQPITMTKIERKSRVQSKENAENNGNSGITLKPTVVAIERVMKEVGSNHFQKEITYLSKGEGQCQPSIFVTPPPPPSSSPSPSPSPPQPTHNPSLSSSPSCFTVDLSPSRLANTDQIQLSKLSQINSLLTENYNLLYNEFFNLKREIREQEVVQEQAFLRQSVNHIESIFNIQTTKALSQIQQVYQSSKSQGLKKAYKNRNQIKMKNVYA